MLVRRRRERILIVADLHIGWEVSLAQGGIHVPSQTPKMLNKLLHKRYLDILITHAPPQGIHDRSDLCHRGFRAFVTFMDRFQPRYLIHGHVHVYSPSETVETMYRNTRVINAYGYRMLEIDEGSLRS